MQRALAAMRRHWLEALLVLVAPALMLFVLGRQGWTPPNTPDSEFYLSLSAFGHQVTDHAAVPAYYWTRLGVVAPLRLLSAIFGADGAYLVWRWLLLTVAVAPVYLVVRRRWSRPSAAAAAAVVALNTVFLTVTGNPYPAAAVVALLVAEAALLAAMFGTASRGGLIAVAALAGAAIGWVAMCNQIAGVYAVLFFIPFAVVAFARTWRRGLVLLGVAAIAGIAAVAALLGAGRVLFPSLDWLETTRYYVDALNPAAFHSSSLDWLRASPFLLVPLIAMATAIVWGIARRSDRGIAWTIATALALTIAYAAYNQFAQGGSLLETPVYAAFLWGPALAALSLVTGWLVAGNGGRVLPWLAAAAVVVVGAGVGWAVVEPIRVRPDALAVALTVIALVAVASRGLPGAPRAVVAAVACVGLVGATQMLQNATPTTGDFISLRVPYWSAFRDTGVAARYALDLDVERWVLATATPGAHLLVWAPSPDLGGVAAMSLNGPNALSMSADLPPLQIAWLRANAPVDVLLMDHTRAATARLGERLRAAGARVAPLRCANRLGTPATGPVSMCIAHVDSVR